MRIIIYGLIFMSMVWYTCRSKVTGSCLCVGDIWEKTTRRPKDKNLFLSVCLFEDDAKSTEWNDKWFSQLCYWRSNLKTCNMFHLTLLQRNRQNRIVYAGEVTREKLVIYVPNMFSFKGTPSLSSYIYTSSNFKYTNILCNVICVEVFMVHVIIMQGHRIIITYTYSIMVF